MRLKSEELEKVEKKLEDARERAENYGRLYGAFATADDYLKAVYAQLLDEAPKDETVDGKSSWVKRQPEYLRAIKRKEEAYADWKTAELYVKILLAEIDVWRTNEASNRWIDKAHS